MAHPSVVINGVTYPDCPEVDIPKSGGGTAKFYDGSNSRYCCVENLMIIEVD